MFDCYLQKAQRCATRPSVIDYRQKQIHFGSAVKRVFKNTPKIKLNGSLASTELEKKNPQKKQQQQKNLH